MKATTRAKPIKPVMMPISMASAPRSAPTVRSSITVSGAGSAPARSRAARSVVCCTVKLPEICPEPPMIGSRMTGALSTLLSSTIANGLPTLTRVMSPNCRAPRLSNRNETTGWFDI